MADTVKVRNVVSGGYWQSHFSLAGGREPALSNGSFPLSLSIYSQNFHQPDTVWHNVLTMEFQTGQFVLVCVAVQNGFHHANAIMSNKWWISGKMALVEYSN